MDKVKIIHCADIHLDTPFKELNGELAEEMRNDIKQVFENIVERCIREEVDLLLIAGDVFDNYSIKRETLNFMEKIFKKIGNTRVFISPGNHDPIGKKSFYKLINWPSNVYIFSENMEYVDVEKLKVRVHGFGFEEKYIYESKLKDVSIREDYINILVGHGDLDKGTSEYNPITREMIRNSRLDYIALGHIHNFSKVERIGCTAFAYSGCPQGRGFDELGDRGILIGEISKGIVNLEFSNMAIKKYYEVEVDISEIKEVFKVKNLILEKIQIEEKALVKIVLKGGRKRELVLDLRWIEERLKENFYFIKIVDKTRIELSEVERQDSVIGGFIEEIDKMVLDGQIDRDILSMALEIGLKSLEGEEVLLDDNY